MQAGDPGAVHTLRSFGPPLSLDRAARLSGPESVIVLHGVRAGEFVLRLQLSAGSSSSLLVSLLPSPGTRDLTVAPGTFAVGPGWNEYAVAISLHGSSALMRPPELCLRTRSDAVDPGGTARGVELGGYTLTPAGAPLARLAAAVPVAGLWMWAAALLGMAAASMARQVAPRPGRPATVVPVVIGVSGLLLAAAAHDPYAFAWALPPPVISIVAISVGFVVMRRRPFIAATSAVDGRRPRLATVAAWTVAGVALAVIYVQHGGFFAAALAFGAAAAWLFSRPGRGEEDVGPCLLSVRWTMAGLAAVLVIASVLRFAHIRDLPYGLWRDDARYGLVALHMMEDPAYRPAYVPEVITLPGLGLRILSLGLRLWGITSWSMRTIAAAAGALTVVPLYGLVRQLSGRRDIALLAAALLAVSSWHVTVSRMTSPAALDPLFALTGLWCLAAGLGVGSPPPAQPLRRVLLLLAAGACLGVSLQTYHSGRAAPLMALVVVAAWSIQPGRRPPPIRDLLAIAVGFTVVAAPFLQYAWRHPEQLNARAAAVFLPRAAMANATAPLAALDASIGRHLAMFHLKGDRNGRRNVPGRSMLDPITGVGFLAGVWALFRRGGGVRGGRLFLAALVLGLVPSVLAVEGPHSLRSIGAAGFACALAAWGLRELVCGVAGLPGARAAVAFTFLVLGALAVNAWTYFEVGAHDERVWRSAYPVETEVGMYVRTLANRSGADSASQVYLSPAVAESSVTQFLVHGLPVRTFKAGFAAPPAGGVFVVASEADRERLESLAARHGVGAPVFAGMGRLLPDGRQPAFTLYRLP